jgi:hypothetical protein
VILFSAAAAAVLYLVARPLARLVGATANRVGGFTPTRVPLLVSRRAIMAAALAAGALLGATNLFDGNSESTVDRILNDATFLGGFMLVVAIALVALGTAVRWAGNAYRA